MGPMNNSMEMEMSDTANDSISCDPQKWKETWWIYIVTSVIIYLVCLGLSTASFTVKLFIAKRRRKTRLRNSNSSCKQYNIYNSFQNFIRRLLLGDSVQSKIVITVNLMCNIIYIILGIYRSYNPKGAGECFSIADEPVKIVEMVVVVELFLFALGRFIASTNIVFYWFSIHTIVDVFTLPHIFISSILGVDWIGLRSLRFVWLTQITSVLRFLPFVNHDSLDIISLFIYFLVLWLTSSGIIHLLEIQGDPWKQFNNGQNNSMLVYAYFIMVTVSTVGYGDFYPETDLGRTFVTFFIIAGLAFFAAILPKLAEMTSSYYQRTQYSAFDTSHVTQHIIVCGHITAVTAEDFLKDFLHPDRGDKITHILFLHPGKPNLALKNVLHSYYTRVQYLDGSVLKSSDLHKAMINTSKAIFILANKYTQNPTEEDYTNLLRLVSVKNTTETISVIIQLLHSFSKKQVFNITSWNKHRDTALCLNEMKLGLLSLSCLCPGFSTLIANLFYTSDFPTHHEALKSGNNLLSWKELYIKGASNEIYCSPLSDFFKGKTFRETALVCYNEFNLVLLALEDSEGLYVNPSTLSYIIHEANGYFIAPNQEQVCVVKDYHPNHNKHNILMSTTIRKLSSFKSSQRPKELELKAIKTQTVSLQQRNNQSLGDSRDDSMLHMNMSQPNHLEKSILNPDTAFLGTTKVQPSVDIKDHIVLCIFADGNSPVIGLHSFLKPLRNNFLLPEAIKPVVIVSDKTFIEKEWTSIRNIPKLHVVVGSPLCWSNLEVANVSECSVCVILTVPSIAANQEQGIDDKEAILCSLSIQNSKKMSRCKKTVHIITDLHEESNVQFLDLGDEDEPDERIYMAQPFACGEAFTASMFDSVTSSVFYSPRILYLVESLIHMSGTNSLCQAIMVPVSDQFWNKKYKDFYNLQLNIGKLCVGISRIMEGENSSQRFVITSPDPDFLLGQSDIAFVLTE